MPKEYQIQRPTPRPKSDRLLDRRSWLKGLFAAGAGFYLGGCASAGRGASSATGATLLPARLSGVPEAALPEGMRIARTFSARRIDGPGARPALAWTPPAARRAWSGGRLRFAVAVDLREERRVEVLLARSGDSLGRFDIRFAYALQPFEVVLTAAQVEAVLREGVILRPDEGTLPLWIFDDRNQKGDREFFAPHLILEDASVDKRANFIARMGSFASLQPFGWLEGCVVDGLQDMIRSGNHPAARAALDAHLTHFLDPDGGLVSEDLRNRPVDNRIPGIEYTLPVAVIASQRPGHPVQQLALDFWESRRRETDIVCDGTLVSAEGSYTIGYPLAVIAVQTGREDLARWALRQITARIEMLPVGSDLYLRCPMNRQGRTFRNWARAYAWYMLGLTRTWTTLHASSFRDLDGMQTLRAEAERISREALRLRRPEGLWTNFLDRPETGIDTSGSAGIAASMAIGARAGLLPAEWLARAREADAAMDAYLTPDGVLGGVAQHNAGGEALQTGGYRVLSQMGMGLLAQLHVATRAGA